MNLFSKTFWRNILLMCRMNKIFGTFNEPAAVKNLETVGQSGLLYRK